MKKNIIALLFLLGFVGQSIAADVSPSHVFIDGEVLFAAQLNTMRDEIVNEVNDLDGDNLAANISITSSGSLSWSGSAAFTGNFSATGNVNVIGNGGFDTLAIECDGGIQYVSASTWTFTGPQTVSGTWANLGVVTTADINGGTIDGVTIGASVAPTVTNLGSVATADINGGTVDGTAIGASSPSTGAFTTLKVGTTNQGDILYDNGTSLIRLTPGTSGQFLKTQGAAANPVWSQDTNASNVLYEWNGKLDDSNSYVGITNSIDPQGVTSGAYLYIKTGNTGGYDDVLKGKFTKIAGVSTITWYARGVHTSTVGGVRYLGVKVDVGGQNSSSTGINAGQTPTWVSNTIDVSGLSNGTTYDITISLTLGTDEIAGGLGNIVLIGS